MFILGLIDKGSKFNLILSFVRDWTVLNFAKLANNYHSIYLFMFSISQLNILFLMFVVDEWSKYLVCFRFMF